MTTENIITILERKGIKPTSMRILIYRTMAGFRTAFSLADLENALDTVDKSTISRTINLFKSICLLHSIDDGTGSVKYAFCHEGCRCGRECVHMHFHCLICGNTYCLREIPIPDFNLPEGFTLETGNFVLKGTCAACGKSAT